MARPEPKRRGSSLTPFYVVLGVLAVAGAGFLVSQARAGGTAATEPMPVELDPAAVRATPGISDGAADAPVVMMEFGDFQCGACAQFAMFTKPLLQEHIDAGTVRFVWYDFPLVQIHPNAFLAARAGRCAQEQGQFWGYHDVLFAELRNWQGVREPVDPFIGYAERIEGLDRRAFSECLRSDRYRLEVTQNMQLGQTMGVQGTPTLFINGKRMTQMPTNRAGWAELIRTEAGTPAAPADVPGDGGEAAAAEDTDGP